MASRFISARIAGTSKIAIFVSFARQFRAGSNLELACADEILAHRRAKPSPTKLRSSRKNARKLTTEGGLDVVGNYRGGRTCGADVLQQADIPVALVH